MSTVTSFFPAVMHVAADYLKVDVTVLAAVGEEESSIRQALVNPDQWLQEIMRPSLDFDMPPRLSPACHLQSATFHLEQGSFRAAIDQMDAARALVEGGLCYAEGDEQLLKQLSENLLKQAKDQLDSASLKSEDAVFVGMDNLIEVYRQLRRNNEKNLSQEAFKDLCEFWISKNNLIESSDKDYFQMPHMFLNYLRRVYERAPRNLDLMDDIAIEWSRSWILRAEELIYQEPVPYQKVDRFLFCLMRFYYSPQIYDMEPLLEKTPRSITGGIRGFQRIATHPQKLLRTIQPENNSDYTSLHIVDALFAMGRFVRIRQLAEQSSSPEEISLMTQFLDLVLNKIFFGKNSVSQEPGQASPHPKSGSYFSCFGTDKKMQAIRDVIEEEGKHDQTQRGSLRAAYYTLTYALAHTIGRTIASDYQKNTENQQNILLALALYDGFILPRLESLGFIGASHPIMEEWRSTYKTLYAK